MGAPQEGQLSFIIFLASATCITPLCFSTVQFLKYPFRIARLTRESLLFAVIFLSAGRRDAATKGTFTVAKNFALRSAVITSLILSIRFTSSGIRPKDKNALVMMLSISHRAIKVTLEITVIKICIPYPFF